MTTRNAHDKIFVSYYVSREYRKLLNLIKDSSQNFDTKKIKSILLFINNACKRKKQIQDETLLVQSLQIAQIVVSEIGLDEKSALCALLYKFAENDTITIIEIKKEIDEKVAQMTEELIKINSIETQEIRSQADSFRKLLLTITSDIRIILIKIAERLYVMRNLENEDQSTQNKISHEVFHLYAPLGHRLGLYSLKTELEDSALKYTNPEMYNYIVKKIQETASSRNKFIKDFIHPIKNELDSSNLKYTIKSRVKSIFSIYNKMIKQNIDFKEVYDLFAIRIILSSNKEKEKSDCWRVFSIITNLYQSNPERMRDWITVPKSNGYESLHTTVYHPDGRWVEVQIRTERMDEIAERGLAAHWKYKGHGTDDNFDKWLNKIRSTIETPYAEELSTLEQINLGHYSKEIYVFTPKGQLKMLPKGATALDFAYEIHTQVGDKCVGAKVNGKSVPIRYELHNGDRVEIITSKNQKPKTDWIDYVITSKAKSKIKLALKEEKVKQAELGKELFQRRLRNWKIPYNDLIVSNLIQYFKLKNAIDLYSLIGNESIEMSEIKKIITQSSKPQESSSPNEQYQVEKLLSTHFEKAEEVLEIDDKILNNVDYKLAKCCSPIFGDDIFAFVTINDGIKIHRIQCPNANDMLTKYGYRVLKAKWRGEDSKTTFLTAIKVAGVDEIGVLAKISDTISKDLHVRMRSINIDSKNNRFEGVIQLFVKDVAYLDMLIHKILKIKGVEIAKRADYISPE